MDDGARDISYEGLVGAGAGGSLVCLTDGGYDSGTSISAINGLCRTSSVASDGDGAGGTSGVGGALIGVGLGGSVGVASAGVVSGGGLSAGVVPGGPGVSSLVTTPLGRVPSGSGFGGGLGATGTLALYLPLPSSSRRGFLEGTAILSLIFL